MKESLLIMIGMLMRRWFINTNSPYQLTKIILSRRGRREEGAVMLHIIQPFYPDLVEDKGVFTYAHRKSS